MTLARIVRTQRGALRVKGADGALLGEVRGPKGRWTVHGPKGALLRRASRTSIRPLALACLLLPKLSEAERLGRPADGPHPQAKQTDLATDLQTEQVIR